MSSHFESSIIMLSKVYTLSFADSDSVLFVIVTSVTDGSRIVTAVGNNGGICSIENESLCETDLCCAADYNTVDNLCSRVRFHDALDGWQHHATECSIDGAPSVPTHAALRRIADVLFS